MSIYGDIIKNNYELLNEANIAGLENYIINLYSHLLKWEFIQNKQTTSWLNTIKDNSNYILDLIKDNKNTSTINNKFSKNSLDSLFAAAIKEAIKETRISNKYISEKELKDIEVKMRNSDIKNLDLLAEFKTNGRAGIRSIVEKYAYNSNYLGNSVDKFIEKLQ